MPTEPPAALLPDDALPQVLAAHLGFHRPGTQQSLHIHRHHVLDVILTGEGSWSRNGVPLPLVAGHAYLYRPGDRAGGRAGGPRGLRFIGIVFRWQALTRERGSAGAAALPPVISIPPAQQPEIVADLRRLVDAVSSGEPGWALRSGGLLASILARLAAATTQPDGARTPSLPQQALALLQHHLADAVEIAAIARALRVSAPYLRKRLVQAFGRPPLQLLHELRLEELRRRLASDPLLPLSHLCRAVGLPDRRHAARLFRRRFGMTPSAFREALPPRPVSPIAPSGGPSI